MAVTVTPNLTLISDADTASSQGTWSGAGGNQDTESKVQGIGSYTWTAAKNARTACTFTPTTNLNLTSAYTYPHIYFWMSCSVFPFAEVKKTGSAASSGLTIRLTDGSGNYREWHVAGKDTWGGEWKCFVIDPSNTNSNDVYASSGTLILTDIDVITFYIDISNSGTIRIIDNVWNDVIRFGEGLTLTGTDFNLVNAAAIDQGVDYQYGILQNIDGVIFCQGRLTVGNGAATTTFNSVDEVLVFRRRPIGAASIAAGGGLGVVNSNLYQIKYTGSGCVATVTGLISKSAGTIDGLRHKIDASDVNADLTITGSTFIRAGIILFASTSDIQSSVFNNCFQIDPSTGIFKYNTISNYVGAGGGAILFPSDDSNFQFCTFINNTDSILYAATSDATSPTSRGHTFDDVSGKYDFNNTTTAVEIAKVSNSNPNSYNPGGSSVTFTASYTHTIKGLELNTEVTYVTAGTSTVLYHVEAATTVDGDGKYKIEYMHSGGANVDILIHHIDYKPDISSIFNITLANANETVKVQMFLDENYYDAP